MVQGTGTASCAGTFQPLVSLYRQRHPGVPQVWAALGSPHGASETTGARHLRELGNALVDASARSGQFEVWFTHMFVQSDLLRDSTGSGEALVVRAERNAAAQVLARFSVTA